MREISNKCNLAIIGAGEVASFHVPSMKAAGFNVVSVAASRNSKTIHSFAKKYKIEKSYSDPSDLIDNSSEWDALLIASPTAFSLDYLKKTAHLKKPILIEKPVSLNHKDLREFLKYKNIRVSYNRRFYKGVELFLKFLKNNPYSLVRISIPEKRRDNKDNINFPNRLPVLAYENSVHIFDLINYMIGKIKWENVSNIMTSKKYLSIAATGSTSAGAIIQLNSCYNSPENFSISATSGLKRIIMEPIEITRTLNGLTIIEPTRGKPLRTYKPKITSQIIESKLNKFKPGFYGQAKDFMNFCKNKNNCIGADIHDAYDALRFADKLIKK
jgi:predicted dehydrogenase